jgi:hypothetical protein
MSCTLFFCWISIAIMLSTVVLVTGNNQQLQAVLLTIINLDSRFLYIQTLVRAALETKKRKELMKNKPQQQ